MDGIKEFLMRTDKKSKEEIHREREKNRSLTVLPKTVQAALGVRAIQKEDCIFQIRKNEYIKIYSVKLLLEENRLAFVERLCGMTINRIRLSVFCKNMGEKHYEYMFMSIYFSGINYSDADMQVRVFETKLYDGMKDIAHISTCSVDSALMFIHMNSAGEVKKYDFAGFNGKKAALCQLGTRFSLYQPVTETMEGEFLCHGRYGICFTGKLFPDRKVNFNKMIKECGRNIQFVVDMQMPTEEEVQAQEHEIKKRYSCSLNLSENRYINLSYLCIALADSKEERFRAGERISFSARENEILLVPCCDRETEAFHSVCSLGIKDFHSMRNVNIEFASSLLL